MLLGTGRRGSNGQIIPVEGNGALDNGGKQDPTFVLRKHSLSNSISQSVSILDSKKVFVDCFWQNDSKFLPRILETSPYIKDLPSLGNL